MTVAEWYAAYAVDGRAWLPRKGLHHQRHWLVRFQDVTHQREVYAHCFSEHAPILLYTPDVEVPGWARWGDHAHVMAREAAEDGQRCTFAPAEPQQRKGRRKKMRPPHIRA